MPPGKSYLTTGEVAKIAGVATQTVIRWAKRGELLPDQVLPSGARRYQPETVQAFLETLKPVR